MTNCAMTNCTMVTEMFNHLRSFHFVFISAPQDPGSSDAGKYYTEITRLPFRSSNNLLNYMFLWVHVVVHFHFRLIFSSRLFLSN